MAQLERSEIKSTFVGDQGSENDNVCDLTATAAAIVDEQAVSIHVYVMRGLYTDIYMLCD